MIMVAKNKFKKLKEQKGQAIFEFIIFIPFLLAMMGIFVSISGAISGSIVQQKATRGYLFYILKGNSMVLNTNDVAPLVEEGIMRMEYKAIGWRRKFSDKTSFATCYKVQSFLTADNSETCDDPDVSDAKSQFIRVYTVFGVCGPNYTYNDTEYVENFKNSSIPSCVLSK